MTRADRLSIIENMDIKDQVLVGEVNNHVFISVEGRGHFQNSHPMKEYALAMIDQGKEDFVIEMKRCTGMDSTFMGVLAGLAIRLKKEKQKQIRLINVSAHNQDLLETLGLSQLVDIVEATEEVAPEVNPVESTSPDKSEVAEHMLEAHETLSDLSELNQVKFKNVIQYIKEDLGNNNG